MSFLSNWWKDFWRKGVFFSWTGVWPQDKNLPDWNCWPKTSTKEECEKEIRDSLKKEE